MVEILKENKFNLPNIQELNDSYLQLRNEQATIKLSMAEWLATNDFYIVNLHNQFILNTLTAIPDFLATIGTFVNEANLKIVSPLTSKKEAVKYFDSLGLKFNFSYQQNGLFVGIYDSESFYNEVQIAEFLAKIIPFGVNTLKDTTTNSVIVSVNFGDGVTQDYAYSKASAVDNLYLRYTITKDKIFNYSNDEVSALLNKNFKSKYFYGNSFAPFSFLEGIVGVKDAKIEFMLADKPPIATATGWQVLSKYTLEYNQYLDLAVKNFLVILQWNLN